MRSTLVLLFASMLAASGCGDDGSSGSDAGGGGGDGGGEDLVAYDEAFSGTCGTTLSCSTVEIQTACTCVDRPLVDDVFATNQTGCSELPTEAGIPRTPEDDFCDPDEASGPPDIGCMMPGSYREAGDPMMVTLYGVADVFGNGGDADAITVEVYTEGADGQLGDLIGSSTSDVASDCAEEEDEIDNDMVIGTRQLGFYAIADVPTETPLIIKTSGNPDFWKDLYTYNIYIFNDEVETAAPPGDACGSTPTGARHEYRARVLSRSDYNSIPLTAGVPAGITGGNGALAGEIHDCSDTRLEFAQVGVSPDPVTLVYFNDNPSNPLPQMGRTEGTSRLGLYAALDLPPGPVDVTAVGRVDDQIVSLGWYRARIFPDSVTSVTLKGLRPHQTE